MNKLRRIIALVMCLIMSLTTYAYANESQINDYEGHWAQETIEKWINSGKVSGYPDGSYKPDNRVTRAEFVKMVNGIIDFSKLSEVKYNDVTSNDWYYDYIGVAQNLGYISGYSETKFGPNDYITREQAASIISRIQYLTDNLDGVENFKDNDKISDWAIKSVGAAAEAGFIKGYPDGNFKPSGTLSRAEALTMIDNVLVNANNVVVYNDGSKINDTVIEGDLIIAKTVGEGDIYLNNIEVKGNIYVYGGGINSVYFNKVKISNIIVEKDKVRLVIGEGTSVQEIEVADETILVNENGTVSKVTLNGNKEVTLTGNFDEVTVKGDTKVVLKDTVITNMVVEKPIIIQGNGKITTLEAKVNGITFESKVKIESTVKGEGVTEAPKPVVTPPTGGDGGTTPIDPGANVNHKLMVSAIVKRTDFETEEVTTISKTYHSFNEYVGTTKLSDALGKEINYVIERLEAGDLLFIERVETILERINAKLDDTQLVEIYDKEEIYQFDGRNKDINWEFLSSYLEGSSAVLPEELTTKNGDFTIEDVISILKLYNVSTIEVDLVKISSNLFEEEDTISFVPYNWPDEGEIFHLFLNNYYKDLTNEVLKNIFSNDPIYLLGEHSFGWTEEYEGYEYEFELVFEAEILED